MSTEPRLAGVDPSIFRSSTRQDATTGMVIAAVGMGLLEVSAVGAVGAFLLLSSRVELAQSRTFVAITLGAMWLAGAAFLSVFAVEAFRRARRMGDFVLDARARTLRRMPAGIAPPIIRVRASTSWAGSIADMGSSWWVLVEVSGGATFRFARLPWSQARPLLLQLRGVGLPVEGVDDAALLRTSGYSVTRRSSTRLELRCPETRAKTIAPLIVISWIAFATMLLGGIVAGYVRGQSDPTATFLCGGPLAIFLLGGVTIGIANLVMLHRRSGVFLLDTASRSLSRGGVELTARDPITRFVTGNPSPFGIHPVGGRFGHASAAAGKLALGLPGLVAGVKIPPPGPFVLAAQLQSGRLFHLLRGLPGDVRFAASLLTDAGLTVEER